MQLDMMLLTMDDLTTAGTYARAIEEMGFAALWTAETQHNPFLPLAVAATATHQRMAAQGDWDGMARTITDEMLDVYAVTGAPDDIPAMLRARYDGLLDRIAFYFPYQPGQHETRWRKFVQAFND